MTELDFAGQAWIARLKELLTMLVTDAGATLEGTRFTMSETFTRVPPGGETTSWAATIEDGRVTFLDGPPAEADFALIAEQAAALPGARLIYAGATPDQLAAASAHREAMIAAGRMQVTGDVTRAGKPLLRVLRTLHDTIARETR